MGFSGAIFGSAIGAGTLLILEWRKSQDLKNAHIILLRALLRAAETQLKRCMETTEPDFVDDASTSRFLEVAYSKDLASALAIRFALVDFYTSVARISHQVTYATDWRREQLRRERALAESKRGSSQEDIVSLEAFYYEAGNQYMRGAYECVREMIALRGFLKDRSAKSDLSSWSNRESGLVPLSQLPPAWPEYDS